MHVHHIFSVKVGRSKRSKLHYLAECPNRKLPLAGGKNKPEVHLPNIMKSNTST